jgi:phage-related protein
MEFRVTFYETIDGDKPLLEFLESLRGKQAPLHNLIVAGLRKLRQRQNHGPPLTAPVEGADGLFELRVGGANIARVFFFFRPGQEIVCTHGYVKKSQRLDSGEVARAVRRMRDWEERQP